MHAETFAVPEGATAAAVSYFVCMFRGTWPKYLAVA